MADLIADKSLICVGVDANGKRLMAPLVPIAIKFNCAKELASYLEPKQRQVTLAGDSDSPVSFQYQLKITLAQAFERAYGIPANQQNGQATALPPGLPVGPIRRP